jgi:hypothetical protein
LQIKQRTGGNRDYQFFSVFVGHTYNNAYRR